jgi:hypothetical protein
MIGQRWGVRDDEVARHYPCDELAPEAAVQLWRGITVDAPAAQVWPWVRQLRLAPYSYDWIDNLGRRSPSPYRVRPSRRWQVASRWAGCCRRCRRST